MPKGRRYTPEQIITKLREAEVLHPSHSRIKDFQSFALRLRSAFEKLQRLYDSLIYRVMRFLTNNEKKNI